MPQEELKNPPRTILLSARLIRFGSSDRLSSQVRARVVSFKSHDNSVTVENCSFYKESLLKQIVLLVFESYPSIKLQSAFF